jgi:hypothetical protein
MTLTSLEFLSVGQEWTPKDEQQRIALYELNKSLYSNDHKTILDTMLNIIYPDKADSENVNPVFINLYRSVSKLWADLLFSEDPKLTNANDTDKTKIDDLITSHKFWKVSKKVAIDVSRYGNGIYKVRRNAEGKAIIEAISPRIWFPVLNPDNINEVQAHVLGFTFMGTAPALLGLTTKAVQYLKVEIHTIGQIQHKLFIINLDNRKIQVELEVKTLDRYKDLNINADGIESTGVDDFLVIPVENSMDSETAFGEDDYTDLNPIVGELEIQLTKYGQDLKEQGNIKYGPKNAIDEDGNVKRNGYIGLMGGANAEQPPGAVTWSVAHEAIKAYIDQLMFFFYVCSETSPAIFNPDVSIGNLSGVALKRLMQRLLLKAGRLAENFDESIKRVLKVAAKLEGNDLGDFEIQWQDGLVSDMLEKANTANVAITSGTMSKKTGIGYVQELEGDALDTELGQIETEKQAETVNALDALYPPDNTNDNGNKDNGNE